jgi:hypothetical protein
VSGTAAISVGGRRYPLVGPSLADPRLHLAAVIVSLQVLGQTVLGFDLSIAQILASLATCAAIEVGITFWQRRAIVWPASALLTGNGVAFILRVPGTLHGDWWSTRGLHLYIAVAALSILSKHLVRVGGRPLFNPSNLGLVVGFLILGSVVADPQDLWWGPLSPAIVATLAVIVAGGVLVTTRQRLLPVAAAFYATFAGGTGVLAASGHCITARWHTGPVCDGSYWWVLVTSPEILVFLLFMITDPKTIPRGRVARVLHGVLVGTAATLFVAPQTTEFATKVAILAALVVACAARPLLERWCPAVEGERFGAWLRAGRRPVVAAGATVLVLAGTIAAGLPARTVDERPPGSAGAGAVRPPVDLPAGAVPRPVIDPTASRVQPPVSAAQAADMARDLVEDLVLEGDALASGDADGAAAAAVDERLAELRSAIARAPGGRSEVDRYRAERLTVLRYQDPAQPQAPPTFAVRFEGTARAGAVRRPVDTTFVLAPVGGHWLISRTA